MVGRKECWEDGGQTEEIHAEYGLHSEDACLWDKSQPCSRSDALSLSRIWFDRRTSLGSCRPGDVSAHENKQKNNMERLQSLMTGPVAEQYCNTHWRNYTVCLLLPWRWVKEFSRQNNINLSITGSSSAAFSPEGSCTKCTCRGSGVALSIKFRR